jgi:hypothetical protein
MIDPIPCQHVCTLAKTNTTIIVRRKDVQSEADTTENYDGADGGGKKRADRVNLGLQKKRMRHSHTPLGL